jgi:hypothetical protein
MYDILVYKKTEDAANISQLSVKRDWMDDTAHAHAYKCFPVTLTNSLGWGISYPEDISFIWDGVSDTSGNHVVILSGHKYCYTERANATISFKTGLVFRTNKNTTLLQMPVPNLFTDEYQSFTTLISTSFFQAELPCALRILKPNKVITIKANTPISSIIPISLSDLQGSSVSYSDIEILNTINQEEEKTKEVKERAQKGFWTNIYRDAMDLQGNKLGEHEVKSIKLKVVKKDNE